MLQLEVRQDKAVLHLDDVSRRALAGVLGDWLNAYVGRGIDELRREHLELVVETRRLLLSPDEPRPLALDRPTPPCPPAP